MFTRNLTKDVLKQIIDYYASQRLEDYLEMPPDEILQALQNDWGEQMRVIMDAVLFRLARGKRGRGGLVKFIQKERADGKGLCLVPVFSGTRPRNVGGKGRARTAV